ncbi:MAG: hypothetical protein JJU48_09715 [Methylophaga sp.]|nr:hypothetical protein [Methylophaga sp.]
MSDSDSTAVPKLSALQLTWLWLFVLSLSLTLHGGLNASQQTNDQLNAVGEQTELLALIREHQQHGFIFADSSKIQHSDGEPHDLLLLSINTGIICFGLLLTAFANRQTRSGQLRFVLAIPRAPPIR